MWHEAYEDPSSSLARRLEVVRSRLGAVLDAAGSDRQQILSLCAGDGRDVIAVLAARASSSISALLVEQDEKLSRRAMQAASLSSLDAVEVRCADAGICPRSTTCCRRMCCCSVGSSATSSTST